MSYMGLDPGICTCTAGEVQVRGKYHKRVSIPDSSAAELLLSLVATGGAIFDQDSLNPIIFLMGRKFFRGCFVPKMPVFSALLHRLTRGSPSSRSPPATHLARYSLPATPERMWVWAALRPSIGEVSADSRKYFQESQAAKARFDHKMNAVSPHSLQELRTPTLNLLVSILP